MSSLPCRVSRPLSRGRLPVAACVAGLLGLSCAPPAPPAPPAPIAAASASASSVPAPAVLAPAPIVPPEPVALVALAEAPCRIATERNERSTMRAAFRGSPFATFRSVESAELRVAGAAATLSVGTRDLDVVGEVDVKSLEVSPRGDDLHEGYLRVLEAHIAQINGDRASLAVRLPKVVTPLAPVRLEVPCADLALRPRTATPGVGLPVAGKEVELADGLSAPLSLEPGGAAFATLRTAPKPKPKPKPRVRSANAREASRIGEIMLLPEETVEEMGRNGPYVRLRLLTEQVEIVGWTRATSLKRRRPTTGMFGLLGALGGAPSKTTLRCAQPVTIYLRRGEEVVSVGRYRARGAIELSDAGASRAKAAAGEIAVALPNDGGWGSLFDSSLDDDEGIGGIGGIGRLAPAPKTSGSPPPPPVPAPARPAPPVAIEAFVRAASVQGCERVVNVSNGPASADDSK